MTILEMLSESLTRKIQPLVALSEVVLHNMFLQDGALYFTVSMDQGVIAITAYSLDLVV